MQHAVESIGKSVVLGPGEGQVIKALGLTMTIRATGADTNGAYVAFEFVLSPGQEVPSHIHPVEESIYVLEGEITTRIGDRSDRMPAGSFCLIQRGMVHAQANEGTAPAKLLLILSPSSIEGLLYEMDGRPDSEIVDVMKKYGMELAE